MGEKVSRRRRDLVLRGSLYTMRRRCGKGNCRCRKGELHETPALSYRVGGQARILTLRPEDVPRVKAATERYRRAKAQLEARAEADIETLRGEIHRDKGSR
jgi:hypothetical protein